jgi:hypothetical protein
MPVSRALAIRRWWSATPSCCTKWFVLGVLVRILLAIIKLLLERLGLLLVGKRQCS